MGFHIAKIEAKNEERAKMLQDKIRARAEKEGFNTLNAYLLHVLGQLAEGAQIVMPHRKKDKS